VKVEKVKCGGWTAPIVLWIVGDPCFCDAIMTSDDATSRLVQHFKSTNIVTFILCLLPKACQHVCIQSISWWPMNSDNSYWRLCLLFSSMFFNHFAAAEL